MNFEAIQHLGRGLSFLHEAWTATVFVKLRNWSRRARAQSWKQRRGKPKGFIEEDRAHRESQGTAAPETAQALPTRARPPQRRRHSGTPDSAPPTTAPARRRACAGVRPPPQRLRSGAAARQARSVPRGPAPAGGGAVASALGPTRATQRRPRPPRLPPARRSLGTEWLRHRPRGARPGRTGAPFFPPSLRPLPAGPSVAGRSGAGSCTAPPCCPRAAALSAARRAAAAARRGSCPPCCCCCWRCWAAAAPRCPRAASTTGVPRAPAKRRPAARRRWRWFVATWSSLRSCLPRRCPTARSPCEYRPAWGVGSLGATWTGGGGVGAPVRGKMGWAGGSGSVGDSPLLLEKAPGADVLFMFSGSFPGWSFLKGAKCPVTHWWGGTVPWNSIPSSPSFIPQ